MKTKKQITDQIVYYLKSYEHTKDFEEFRMNIFRIIEDIEEITPVTPAFASFLFHVKLDCENIERSNASTIILSLENFLKKLP